MRCKWTRKPGASCKRYDGSFDGVTVMVSGGAPDYRGDYLVRVECENPEFEYVHDGIKRLSDAKAEAEAFLELVQTRT